MFTLLLDFIVGLFVDKGSTYQQIKDLGLLKEMYIGPAGDSADRSLDPMSDPDTSSETPSRTSTEYMARLVDDIEGLENSIVSKISRILFKMILNF